MADTVFEWIGFTGRAIFHQFDAHHEAALADLPDVRVFCQWLEQLSQRFNLWL